MVDQRLVETVHRGQRQLQHDLPVHAVQSLQDFIPQDLLGLGLVHDLDVHFRLQDRHQAVAQNLPPDGELLIDVRGDALGVGRVDHRAHLGAEDTLRDGAFQKIVQIAHRLHHLNAVGLVHQPLVALQERNHALVFPEIGGGGLALERAVHGHLEQDRADHLLAGEGRGAHDARPHLVDQVEHLGFRAVAVLVDPVEL